MRHLLVLGNPDMKQLRLVEAITPKWEEASHLLGLSNVRIDIIKLDNMWRGVEVCCRAVLHHWLYDSNPRFNYGRSWNGLLKLLMDLEMSELAKDLTDIVFQ